jgi:hypothetical protein
MPLWVPLLLGLGAWRIYVNATRKGLTPERKAFFLLAMKTWKDPERLSKLADLYAREGLSDEANQLRARAKLPQMGTEEKEDLARALRKGLNSTDPVKIVALSESFEKKGATASANLLQQYAAGLAVAARVPPIVVASPKDGNYTEAPPPEAPMDSVYGPAAQGTMDLPPSEHTEGPGPTAPMVPDLNYQTSTQTSSGDIAPSDPDRVPE